MFPSGGTPVLAAAPLNWGSFGAESNTFPRSRAMWYEATQRAPCFLYKWQQYRCTMQHLGQGPVNAANSQRFYKSGRFGWRVAGGGWWRVVVVVGSEPVHDSLHVTYRLLAPGTEPSRGPQPITLI